jgi:menaquinone-dependent protoporphyrinogen oxidase
LTRWIMRRMAAREGAPTDTRRDHEFTNWTSVREFARAVAQDVRAEGMTRAS